MGKDMKTISNQAEREIVRAGVKAGLEDSKVGRGRALTDEYIEELKIKAQRRINTKHTQRIMK